MTISDLMEFIEIGAMPDLPKGKHMWDNLPAVPAVAPLTMVTTIPVLETPKASFDPREDIWSRLAREQRKP